VAGRPPEVPPPTAAPAIEVAAVPVRIGLLGARFRATVPVAGVYEVAARWPAGVAGAVEYCLLDRGGERLVPVDRGARGGEWVVLGRVHLEPAVELRIDLTGRDGIGRVAGEIRLRSVP
jgi:hypothetical protein